MKLLWLAMWALGRPRYRKWVFSIKMDLGEMEWDGMEWIDWLGLGISGGIL
jgi:hypothetical protein